jgi:hypothetical protein
MLNKRWVADMEGIGITSQYHKCYKFGSFHIYLSKDIGRLFIQTTNFHLGYSETVNHWKQEDHDGPEVAHLYIGPMERGQFELQGFYLNKLGRHPLEDVSC